MRYNIKMSKHKRLNKLNQELSKIQEQIEKEKVQDSEKPLTREQDLNEALEELKENIKEIGKKYDLSLFEMFGILKAFEIDLIEQSKE